MTILFLVYVYVLLLNFSMFNIVQYPNDTHFLKPLGLLGAGVLVHEVISHIIQLITYPFERMASRSIATQTGRQLSAVWREEGVRGLYRGLSIGVGRSVMQHVAHYYIFQVLFLKAGLNPLVKGDLEPSGQPLLKYCEGPMLHLIALTASLGAVFFTQAENVVRLKI